ncbi:hypothetical protein ACJJTC_011139 [Scirpophaga incertulas]
MKASTLKSIYSLVKPNYTSVRAITVQANATHITEQQSLKDWREIPGPSGIPFLGQIRHFLPGGEFYNMNFEKMFENLYNKYGSIVKFDAILGKLPFIIVFDPDTCAHVLRSENWMPVRTGFETLEYYRTKYEHNESTKTKFEPNVQSTGLLTEHNDAWKQFRSTVNPVMLHSKTIQQYSNNLDEVAQDMIARLRYLRGPKNTIESDFEMEMNLWALESIALVSLGRRLHCFSRDLPPDSPEKRLIKVVHDIFHVADALDIKPSIWRYYGTKTFKKAMNLYKEQERLTRYFIDETIKDLEKQKINKSEEEKSVLEKLLSFDKNLAVIMASDSLFAGVDTTSNTITGTLYQLARNQDKQDKLREELFSDSEKKPYLKACIKESMRIMPIITGNMRKTTKEYDLHGYRIPKGFQISVMHQQMSRMESQYPQAKKYLPERWVVNKDDPLHYGNASPFATQPFGFGVRSCIGRRIAELEMEVFLSKIIKNFKVEWFGPPIKVESSGLNYIKGPFNFTFTDL